MPCRRRCVVVAVVAMVWWFGLVAASELMMVMDVDQLLLCCCRKPALPRAWLVVVVLSSHHTRLRARCCAHCACIYLFLSIGGIITWGFPPSGQPPPPPEHAPHVPRLAAGQEPKLPGRTGACVMRACACVCVGVGGGSARLELSAQSGANRLLPSRARRAARSRVAKRLTDD
jgi:hypothetical protein